MNEMPTLEQSRSLEQVFVTLSNGSGSTRPGPRSEQPVASGPHSPWPPLIGMWHLTAEARQPLQSASLSQVPLTWPGTPHAGSHVPWTVHESPPSQPKTPEHSLHL